MIRSYLRPLLAIVGSLAVFALAVAEVDARPGGGRSMGSRGDRTFSAPPATKTAPAPAQPMQRTATQPSQPSAAAGAPAAAGAAAAAKPGLFNRPGFLGGLAAGMLGAGLLGMLFGQGLFGNLAGFASIIGLLLQIVLVGGIAYFAWQWWQRRSQPQTAMAMPGGGPSVTAMSPMSQPEPQRAEMASAAPLQGASYVQGQQPEPAEPSDEIGIKGEDYEAFERLLGEVQTAYSREDMAALRARATPEMYGYMSEELSGNTSNGVVADLSGVKLLQGDLAEAWREGNLEYATVAMRYEIIDKLVDRATKQIVDGQPTPVEVTELWTFARTRGGTWLLSGIQQVGDEQQQ